MAGQELAGTEISGSLLEDGDFCSSQTVRAVIRWIEADQADPIGRRDVRTAWW